MNFISQLQNHVSSQNMQPRNNAFSIIGWFLFFFLPTLISYWEGDTLKWSILKALVNISLFTYAAVEEVNPWPWTLTLLQHGLFYFVMSPWVAGLTTLLCECLQIQGFFACGGRARIKIINNVGEQNRESQPFRVNGKLQYNLMCLEDGWNCDVDGHKEWNKITIIMHLNGMLSCICNHPKCLSELALKWGW